MNNILLPTDVGSFDSGVQNQCQFGLLESENLECYKGICNSRLLIRVNIMFNINAVRVRTVWLNMVGLP